MFHKHKVPKEYEIQMRLMLQERIQQWTDQKAMVEEIFKRQIKRGVIV